MPLLITRLHGKRVALNQIDSGVGPRLWLAEYRDAANRPIPTSDGPYTQRRYAVIAGPNIGAVLTGLIDYDSGRP